ncbi:g10434 [Coccomyxa viridis]|uniref:G10434 protein n=1 Tax=Coccomyxa viridis TaxID=1274662 RepID=A0ABP1G9X4_9CHLO
MSESSCDIYWRLAAQCDGSIEHEKPTNNSKSAGTGRLLYLEGANIAPLCALSKSEAHLAVTLNNGFISVCEGQVKGFRRRLTETG